MSSSDFKKAEKKKRGHSTKRDRSKRRGPHPEGCGPVLGRHLWISLALFLSLLVRLTRLHQFSLIVIRIIRFAPIFPIRYQGTLYIESLEGNKSKMKRQKAPLFWLQASFGLFNLLSTHLSNTNSLFHRLFAFLFAQRKMR